MQAIKISVYPNFDQFTKNFLDVKKLLKVFWQFFNFCNFLIEFLIKFLKIF